MGQIATLGDETPGWPEGAAIGGPSEKKWDPAQVGVHGL